MDQRVCPVCGDHKFGSSQLPDGTLERMCHGYLGNGQPCTHRWHQSEDEKNGVVNETGTTEMAAQVRPR